MREKKRKGDGQIYRLMSFRPTIWRRLKQSSSLRAATPKPGSDPGPKRSRFFHFDPSPRVRAAGRFGFYMFAFASWLPVLSMVNEYVFEVTKIDGPSMYPYFNPDRDRTLRRDLVLNFKYGAQDDLQRGMIITFW